VTKRGDASRSAASVAADDEETETTEMRQTDTEAEQEQTIVETKENVNVVPAVTNVCSSDKHGVQAYLDINVLKLVLYENGFRRRCWCSLY